MESAARIVESGFRVDEVSALIGRISGGVLTLGSTCDWAR
jgi:hypothetical protein